MTRSSTALVAAALALCAGTAATASSAIADAQSALRQRFPGVRTFEHQGKTTHVYGVPMTMGVTAHAAAEDFMANHAGALGAADSTFAEAWWTTINGNKHTAINYTQSIDGVPVEYGDVRVLVLNHPFPRVVMAAGNLAQRPVGGFAEARLAGEQAVQLVRAQPLYRGLDTWSAPAKAVWQGENGAAKMTWKFVGSAMGSAEPKAYTFFVDVATAQIVHVRSEIYHNTVSGTVRANVTPTAPNAALPDTPTNTPILLALPEVRGTVQGVAGEFFADRNGNYSVQPPGAPATVIFASNVANGGGARWVNVIPTGASPLVSTGTVNSLPGVANITLNPTPSERLTAQANTLLHTVLTHNFIKDRAPNFNGISVRLTANTGVSGTCNAFYSSANQSINFFNAGGGCYNTAYSSVVAHEYGHFVVNRLSRPQGSFGEGIGDSISILQYDDPIVGRNFFTNGGLIRHPVAAGVNAPCSGGPSVHFCGQVMGAVWTRVRNNYGSYYGSGPGLDRARDLFVSWLIITAGWGASGTPSPVPTQQAIEMLTVDDNDGTLSNGTPNYSLICQATTATGIPCPAIACPTNCDGSSGSPLLTPADLVCFLNNYRAGFPSANCDGSTGSPALTPADLVCFLNRFRAGC